MKRFLLFCLPCSLAAAEPHFAPVFQHQMVLQRNINVPVWGEAAPGTHVTVQFAGQSKEVVVDGEGRWIVRLDPLDACATGRVLAIANGPAVTNVLVGDVWLASGQSNMRFMMREAAETNLVVAADPGLRLCRADGSAAGTPQRSIHCRWNVSDATSSREFSAVAWHFGQALHRRLRVPIGLIDTSVGGTCIEAWTRRAVLEPLPGAQEKLQFWDANVADPSVEKQKFDRLLAMWKKNAEAAKQAGRPIPREPHWTDPAIDQNRPGNLFNGCIAPLIPFAIRGVIWYQGEGNGASLADATSYRELFPAMISDWRAQWQQGDVPFLFVQLPNYEGGMFWPWLREAQTAALKLPETAMAVTIDVGAPDNIHPPRKQPVGERLALTALKMVYRYDLDAAGPALDKDRTMPPTLQLIFRNTGGGLELRKAEGNEPAFQIAGADRKFFPAEAVIVGETLRLSSPYVPVPVAARYAWWPNPPAVLFGKNGLPAAPFRTDEWPPASP